jgi:hypothetical protein
MTEANGSASDDPAAAALHAADNLDKQLSALSEKLRWRGLESELVTYPVKAVKGEHYDVVKVTNPAAPERGIMHIESDGCVTWEYSGSLDDAGISKIADEATNALRATGMPYRPGQAT